MQYLQREPQPMPGAGVVVFVEVGVLVVTKAWEMSTVVA
jgi:hypothetical protein